MFTMLPEKLREFYNTSPMREGVLCWYPFRKDAYVLDISHGALTEMLNDRCGRVATEDTGAIEQFDYIVALDPTDFCTDALKKLHDRLNANGRLLLAYENPYALRYWAGKRAPNTRRSYDTLFGRGETPLPSKAELQVRLNLAGFGGQKWYYPLTDHWFTTELYSEALTPNEHLNQRFIPYISEDGFIQFDERSLYREVIRGGAFEFMCGAYLVEARVHVADAPCPVDYAAITAYREPAKRFATVVRNDGTVHKTPLHPDGLENILKIHQNHEDLTSLGVDVVKTRIEYGSLIMPRLSLPTLWDYWAAKLTYGTLDEVEMFSHFDRIYEAIQRASVKGKCYWELVPANCFYDEQSGRITFFDQEYCWDNTLPDIAVVRAIKSIDYSPVFQKQPRSGEWTKLLKNRYGLSANWERLVEVVDSEATAEVFGREIVAFHNRSNDAAAIINRRSTRTEAEASRYERFCPVVSRLQELGIKNHVVYGCGTRGKTLGNVFYDNGLKGTIFIDQKSEEYKTLDDLPAGTGYDAVIVSILHGEEIACELRGKTQVPVYTLRELIGESIE